MAIPVLDLLAERTKSFLLIVMSLLFVCVLFWIILSIFATQKESEVSGASEKLASPLNPVLDTSQLTKIENKRYTAPEELQSFPVNILLTDPKSKTKYVTQVQP